MSERCTHTDMIQTDKANSRGCEDCLAIGAKWIHLRRCATCGHVGCCDSSQHKHARQHFKTTAHPIVQSHEPGEVWYWCFADQVVVEP